MDPNQLSRIYPTEMIDSMRDENIGYASTSNPTDQMFFPTEGETNTRVPEC